MATNNKKERIAARPLEAAPGFEAVSISGADFLASTEDRPKIICIQLPNQIRCEFPILAHYSIRITYQGNALHFLSRLQTL